MDNMAQAEDAVQPLLQQFQQLFFISKIAGILPQDLEKFRSRNLLEKSRNGMIYVLSTLILYVVLYNILIYSFGEEDRSLKASQSQLTIRLERCKLITMLFILPRHLDFRDWLVPDLYRSDYDGLRPVDRVTKPG